MQVSVKKIASGRVLTNAGAENYRNTDFKMPGLFQHFLKDDTGQDLIEYTLLLGFVAPGSAALFTGAGRSVKGVWIVANTTLASANLSAS